MRNAMGSLHVNSDREVLYYTALITLIAVAVPAISVGVLVIAGHASPFWAVAAPIAAVIIPLFIAAPIAWLAMQLLRMLTVTIKRVDEFMRLDFLTGVLTRAFMLGQTRERLREGGAFLMVDADHFKSINDTYGHDVGDEALKRIAYVLSTCLKNEAIVGRLGGEEFGVFLPKATGSEVTDAAQALVEAMRQHGQTVGEHALNMTISIGGAEHIDGQPLEMTMKLADTALYQAKRSGRDRYVIATADVTMPGLLKRSASEMAKDAQRPEQASSAA